ncbi:MAG: NAD(P)H-dependent oxidoreductase [Chitinophagaceae bacterium]|nr:NAD(P)H-dependent oxidoreductase [Chitinophagaceae bacterium]
MDIPNRAARPESVKKFRQALSVADGIIIASPEYNYSIPGGLKTPSTGHREEKIHH